MGSATKVRFWSTNAELCLNMGEIERKQGGKSVFSPRVIKFVRGQYETADPEELERLRSASIFGTKLFEHDAQDEEDVAVASAAIRAARAGKTPTTQPKAKVVGEATAPKPGKIKKVTARLVGAFTPTPAKK